MTPGAFLRDVKRAARATGKPFEIEHRAKHYRLKVDGEIIGVFSTGRMSDSGHRDGAMLFSKIRKLMP